MSDSTIDRACSCGARKVCRSECSIFSDVHFAMDIDTIQPSVLCNWDFSIDSDDCIVASLGSDSDFKVKQKDVLKIIEILKNRLIVLEKNIMTMKGKI